MNRKKRSDRNHLIYQLTCLDTGESYIGVTVMRGRAQQKTLATRWQQHQYRAYNQDKDWALSRAIRTYDNWVTEAIAVLRGKKEAHAYETELIDDLQPSLNTHKKTLQFVGLSEQIAWRKFAFTVNLYYDE